ncbi:MAG: amidohydrolase, partial [Desulfobacterales bacterium]
MFSEANAIRDEMIAWRRHLHRHPEVSFQENATAQFIVEKLSAWGLEVVHPVARTGVVARVGRGRPCIALRADMDALPLTEATDLDYASETHGAMHACGHDAHMAALLGVARLMADDPPPRGSVTFVFQPSEEKI